MTKKCPKCGDTTNKVVGKGRWSKVVECAEGHLYETRDGTYYGSLWGSSITLGSREASAAELARALAVSLLEAEEALEQAGMEKGD